MQTPVPSRQRNDLVLAEHVSTEPPKHVLNAVKGSSNRYESSQV
jgi:hypothetical protein